MSPLFMLQYRVKGSKCREATLGRGGGASCVVILPQLVEILHYSLPTPHQDSESKWIK